MLKRAWYVLAGAWALFMLWIGSFDPGNMQTGHFAAVALGPLAVPTILRWFFRFVITGSVARPRRAIPYRRV